MVENTNKMKNYLKILLSLIVFISISCGVSKNTPSESVSMMSLTKWITEYQLDSVCFHDHIARDLDEWFSMPFYDYETGATINRKMFIKYSDDSVDNIYYFITPTDSLYEFTKRITVKSKPE